ncbi:MAG: hypothetical protein RLZZ242_252 [Bacteroidota bacterium]
MTNPIMRKFLFLAFAFVLVGCSDEAVDETIIDPGTIDNNTPEPGLSSISFSHPSFNVANPTQWLQWKDKVDESLKDESVDQQDFIWNAMNIWYFWKSQTPDLSENRFKNLQEYLDYLKGFSSAESMITAITNTEDRFTFFNEDYTVLINSLGGISKSDGLEFGLVANSDSEDVIIYTRYVARGSSAEQQGIQRGDLFNRIDGQVLTRSNYLALLNGRADTYTLGKAEQDASGAFLSTEGEVSLTRVENFQENPVQHHSIFLSGNKKVGYLVYNQFITAYSGELNEIFATFKSNAIDELIIDLRYNPGGSTAAAASLASMIHDGSGVFAKQRWNTYWTSMFGSGLEDRFTNEITVNNATVALNRLGMKRVYILTQSGTASSSELLINGLNPYIEVVQIGETTRGKNEFSITLVDDPGSQSGQTVFPYLFQSSRTDQINPNNRLALQPLVGKYENSQGFSDYTDGLEPLISYSEIEQVNGRIVFNLGPFGSLEDGLFAQAISHVNGGLANRRAVRSMGEAVEDLKPSEPLMFVEF